MAFQITNPAVVRKIESVAKATGLSKTAVVERAVDSFISELAKTSDQTKRIAALLAQLDRIPDCANALDSLTWDERGLPK
jgi:antitoxin VapB